MTFILPQWQKNLLKILYDYLPTEGGQQSSQHSVADVVTAVRNAGATPFAGKPDGLDIENYVTQILMENGRLPGINSSSVTRKIGNFALSPHCVWVPWLSEIIP